MSKGANVCYGACGGQAGSSQNEVSREASGGLQSGGGKPPLAGRPSAVGLRGQVSSAEALGADSTRVLLHCW